MPGIPGNCYPLFVQLKIQKMKRNFLISTIVSLFLSFISNAQTNSKNNRPVVTKGYYSIGNHSQKLAIAVLKTFPLSTQPVIQKGYYSIESNRKNLPASSGVVIPKNKTRVTKGYYGIGDHYKKLK